MSEPDSGRQHGRPEEYLTTAALRALLNPGTVTLPQGYKAEFDATS